MFKIFSPDYYKRPDVLHYNCEEPRAYYIPYSNEKSAGVFKYVAFSIFEDGNSVKKHNPNGNVLPFFEMFNGGKYGK